MAKNCEACVKAQLRGRGSCTKHANMLAARVKKWRKKNPERAAFGAEAGAMSAVANCIARLMLDAEAALD